ncbi:MAG: hypothetical protein HY513_02280 [Candidatus Aenigmarchaeota archaeon]|nr:hypothetical protein [Candidatus Aenigmarchaeota archaeon]
MFPISLLRRNSVYSLRKRYDRVREHADKLKDYNRKMHILRMLDVIEPNLILLEENRIQSRFEKRRLVAQIKATVENANELVKMKDMQ